MTVLRKAAITCGILSQRTCDRSSSKVTSRTQCDWLSEYLSGGKFKAASNANRLGTPGARIESNPVQIYASENDNHVLYVHFAHPDEKTEKGEPIFDGIDFHKVAPLARAAKVCEFKSVGVVPEVEEGKGLGAMILCDPGTFNPDALREVNGGQQ